MALRTSLCTAKCCAETKWHGGVLAGRAMFLGSPKNKEECNGAGVSVLHAFPKPFEGGVVSWKEDEASKRVQGAEMNTRHGGVLAGRAMFLGSPKNKEENNGAGDPYSMPFR
jgi:hypothetical protein